MKITIITNEYSVEGGGLSYSCQQFHHLLEKLECDITILSSSVNDKNIIHGGYNKNLGMALAQEAKLKKDIFNIETSQLLIAFGGGFNAYYAALLAKKTNTRLWVMFRGSDGNLAKWNVETCFQTNFAVSVAERLICLSKELADNVKLITARDIQIDVIPNYALRKENIVKPLPKGHLHVGCGATHMNEKKGISNLIELVAAYNKMYKQGMNLDIVGDIDDDVFLQYQKMAKAYSVQDSINFFGGRKREDFRKIQQNWDLYIQTSVCEGMGNSVTDSMSLGIPVMISDTGFIAEYVDDHFPQMVFSSASPEVMANNIYDLQHDECAQKKYQDFYNSFFDTISIDHVRNLWLHLLNIDKPKRISPDPESIISVSMHDINGKLHDNITTPIDVFRKFCEDVYRTGYSLCSMNSYLALNTEERKHSIVCTFDDGYVGLLHNAMPIMNEFNFTATVFVCTDYIGHCNDWNYKDKEVRQHLSIEELYELKKHGWEIGSHGVTHRSLLRLNDEELTMELKESKRILENKFGPVTSYAYPYGDYSEYVMKQVRKYYLNAFLLTQGGVFLSVDSLRIRRYYISEIYKIICCS